MTTKSRSTANKELSLKTVSSVELEVKRSLVPYVEIPTLGQLRKKVAAFELLFGRLPKVLFDSTALSCGNSRDTNDMVRVLFSTSCCDFLADYDNTMYIESYEVRLWRGSTASFFLNPCNN